MVERRSGCLLSVLIRYDARALILAVVVACYSGALSVEVWGGLISAQDHLVEGSGRVNLRMGRGVGVVLDVEIGEVLYADSQPYGGANAEIVVPDYLADRILSEIDTTQIPDVDYDLVGGFGLVSEGGLKGAMAGAVVKKEPRSGHASGRHVGVESPVGDEFPVDDDSGVSEWRGEVLDRLEESGLSMDDEFIDDVVDRVGDENLGARLDRLTRERQRMRAKVGGEATTGLGGAIGGGAVRGGGGAIGGGEGVGGVEGVGEDGGLGDTEPDGSQEDPLEDEVIDCCYLGGSVEAGCEDSECADLVCAGAPECCSDRWQPLCAELAIFVCAACADAG